MPFIELDHLSHRYHADSTPALDDISLSIEAGEFVAILGTNGSGKSTLAKHLNALLLPTKGTCRIAGMDTKDTSHAWDIRAKISMVFQNPDNQILAAIVEDDVAFGAENLGIPTDEIKRRVTEALRAVGMEEFRTFAPHLLSGGQKQRIAIAGALAMQTEAIIFDEATAMLDPQGRAEVLKVVRALHDEKKLTVLFITHFMEEALHASRILLMNEGKIVADGTPREIFAQKNLIERCGLSLPIAARTAAELKKSGLSLPTVLTSEDLITALLHARKEHHV